MAFLQVENLSKTFGDSEALKSVSFALERGETLAVLGASGSGKTTLLRCLNLLEQADEGRVYLGDKLLFDAAAPATDEEAKRQIRAHFGLVFQQFNLFSQYTALENVTLAPTLEAKRKGLQVKDEIIAEAKMRLREMGLQNMESRYPHELSGGQQQRVAIARALMQRPDVLCFDEPTSALDPALSMEVARVINSLKSDSRSMIIVTHEFDFARATADKVLMLQDGECTAIGDAKALI